jgi:hypothetical protein
MNWALAFMAPEEVIGHLNTLCWPFLPRAVLVSSIKFGVTGAPLPVVPGSGLPPRPGPGRA